MNPTGEKNQSYAKNPQRSMTGPAYVNDYVNRYSRIHGFGHTQATFNTNSNSTHSPLYHTYRPHSNMTPTFTQQNQPMPFGTKKEPFGTTKKLFGTTKKLFGTKKENVKQTAIKMSIEHASDSRQQGGVEIYDFNETWRREMQNYKEHTNTRKLSSHQYHHNDVRVHQHRISPHNHENQNRNKHNSYAQQQHHQNFNQFQLPPAKNKKQNNFTALVNAAHQYAKTSHIGSNGTSMNNHAIIAINGKPKANVMVSNNGTRNMTITNVGIGTSAAVKKLNFLEKPRSSHNKPQQSLKHSQEPLKRLAQNEAVTASAQRYVNNMQQESSPPVQADGERSSTKLTYKQTSPNSQKTIYRKLSPYRHSSPKRQPSRSRVIVNQYHASHLLSGQHNDKNKFLAQNGLAKSAASTYASTLYAKAVNQAAFSTRTAKIASRHVFPTYRRNSVGVSLVSDRVTQRPSPILDDPCTAIDNNDYSESTDEEEYKGEPFYLPNETEKDTQQSLCIRYQPEGEDIKSEEDKIQAMYYKPKTILTPSLFPNVPAYINFSCHISRGPYMPEALHKVVKWKLSPFMPRIVKRIVLNSGFRIIKNTTDWMAVWEKHMQSSGFKTIRSHQKYNHLPGSLLIGRKDTMWKYIHKKIKKFGTAEFGFMQKSFVLPEDLDSLRKAWPKNVALETKWIIKPPASARGTGIRIVNKWSQIPKDRPVVVQKYIEKPLLINDNKFDMRIYVLITSINPLRIYMYKDGLARFAAEKYSPELDRMGEKCMHLTNYSINKLSVNYTKNEDFNLCQGHKWTLQSLWSLLEARKVNTKRLWATLRNLVIKAIISGESGLNRIYHKYVNSHYNCFELFGFDILLDENLVPWLLEINVSPSLHSELPLDLHIKGPLLQAVFNTALYQIPPKLSEKMQHDLAKELNLTGSICYDKRLFTTSITPEELRKHNQFINVKCRENYLNEILDHLLPNDIRCLIISEDEYARCNPLERIFPTVDTHRYLQFTDHPRYYNRLLDAWEHKYGHNRKKGINLLCSLCEAENHLTMPETANENEPMNTLTHIDMMHQRKDDDVVLNQPTTSNKITYSQQSKKTPVNDLRNFKLSGVKLIDSDE